MSRFDYIRYNQSSTELQLKYKEQVELLEKRVNKDFEDSDNRKNAIKALEEFYMWTGKLVRDKQLKKDSRNSQPDEARGLGDA